MPEYCDTQTKVILEYLNITILKYGTRSGSKEKDQKTSCSVKREKKERKAGIQTSEAHGLISPVSSKLPQQLPNNTNNSESRTTPRKDPKYRKPKSTSIKRRQGYVLSIARAIDRSHTQTHRWTYSAIPHCIICTKSCIRTAIRKKRR